MCFFNSRKFEVKKTTNSVFFTKLYCFHKTNKKKNIGKNFDITKLNIFQSLDKSIKFLFQK